MRFGIALLVVGLAVGCGKKEDKKDVTSDNLTLVGSGASEGNVSAGGDGVDASSLKIKVYSLYASENEDCTDPVEVFSNEEAEEVDFLDEPTLGEGVLAKGTYECVMIEMDDYLKFTPTESLDTCDEGEEYEIDVCRQGTYIDIDGEEQECDSEANKVILYLSTLSEMTSEDQNDENCGEQYENCNTFAPPSADAPLFGLNLGSALEIAAAINSAFVVDTTGRVVDETDNDGNPACGLQPPLFSFEER